MYPLSDEFTVKRTHQGIVLYHASDLYQPVAILSHGEMLELLAWYCPNERHPGADLAAYVIKMVRLGKVDEATAITSLRALMARTATRAADQALASWIQSPGGRLSGMGGGEESSE